MRYIKKVYQIIRRGGAKEFSHRLKAKVQYHPAKRQREYQRFLRATRPSVSELAEQRQTSFKYRPCFGVVIPLYNTKPEYLRDLLDSFKAQTYEDFKLFMVDASPSEKGKTSLTDFMRAEAKTDSRIIYQVLTQNAGIASNTNQAIRLAMQDTTVTHIALCDHDDFIEPETFFEYTKILNQYHNVRIIYSDEDVVRFKNDPKASYVMKPDFNPYLLESCNYINHFFVCDKELLGKIKTEDGLYEQPEYDGAQDYDLYLRLVDEALKLDHELKPQESCKIKNAIYTSSTIYHLPKVLYHWRAAENSTASDPHNKLYAYDAARRTIEAYLKRQGIKHATVEHTEAIGTYRTKYQLESKPLVSVIISGPANTADLDRIISSLQSGTYQKLEFIITKGHFEVKDAHGDILLFLDNNLEMLAPDSIAEMVAILERTNVGAVGAELLFSDDNLEHAGIIVGLEVDSGHIFYRMNPNFTYGNRANCVTNYSATSSSCLMVKKSTYQEVNGFDKKLPELLRGIDFCLKIRALGKQVIYTPYAQFRYYKKPLATPTPEEMRQFRDKWLEIYRVGDPYYNHNFSLRSRNCSLRDMANE